MIKSKKHLLSLLRISKTELHEILSDIDSFYYQKEEVKKDKKGNTKVDKNGNPRVRIMHPSTGELKNIQSRIKDRIFSKIKFPYFVQGGVKKCSNLTNASFHKGNKFFFITDVKNFFPTIKSRDIYQTFISQQFSPDIAHILTKLTTFRGQLPQGTPTSTALANLTFIIVDERFIKFCLKNSLTYTRYVDDITISGKSDFQSYSSIIIRIITNSGYAISRKKTSYKIGPTDITGISVRNNYLTTTKDFKDTLFFDLPKNTLISKLHYHKRIKANGLRKRKKLISIKKSKITEFFQNSIYCRFSP